MKKTRNLIFIFIWIFGNLESAGSLNKFSKNNRLINRIEINDSFQKFADIPVLQKCIAVQIVFSQHRKILIYQLYRLPLESCRQCTLLTNHQSCMKITQVTDSNLRKFGHVLFQVRTSRGSLTVDDRGLLWILDEEAIMPGATEDSFMERLFLMHGARADKSKINISMTHYVKHYHLVF